MAEQRIFQFIILFSLLNIFESRAYGQSCPTVKLWGPEIAEETYPIGPTPATISAHQAIQNCKNSSLAAAVELACEIERTGLHINCMIHDMGEWNKCEGPADCPLACTYTTSGCTSGTPCGLTLVYWADANGYVVYNDLSDNTWFDMPQGNLPGFIPNGASNTVYCVYRGGPVQLSSNSCDPN